MSQNSKFYQPLLIIASLFLLPVSINRVITHDWNGFVWTIFCLIILFSISPLLKLSIKVLISIFGVSILVYGTGLFVDRWLNDRSFNPQIDRIGLDFQGPIERLTGPITVKRDFKSDTKTSQVKFAARVIQSPKKGWQSSNDRVIVTPIGKNYRRIFFGVSNDSYAFVIFHTAYPIKNRTFRASIKIKSDKTIEKQGCRGIWLQESGGDYVAKCQSIPITGKWTDLSVTYRFPDTAQSTNLQVVINDFDGFTIDISDVFLEELVNDRWISFDNLPVRLSLDNNQSFDLKPSIDWQNHIFSLKNSSTSEQHTLLLAANDGFSVEIKDISLINQKQKEATPINGRRAQLWFSHPNLAGHTIAVISLAFLTLLIVDRPKFYFPLVLFCLLFTVLGLFATESRTAAVAFFFGLILIFIQNNSRLRKVVLPIIILAIIVGYSTGLFGRLGRLVDDNAITRSTIWPVAIQVIVEHPLTGVDNFAGFFRRKYPNAPENVYHAHNFWLQQGVDYGCFGLIGSILFTIGLLYFVWRQASFLGLSFLLPILLMNTFDNTLFFFNILSVVIFTLANLKKPANNKFLPNP